DLQPGRLGCDLLERAAVGVPGLHVEGVGLAGPAVHPQQDARALARRVGRRRLRQVLDPARAGGAERAGRRQPQPLAPRQARQVGLTRHGGYLLRGVRPRFYETRLNEVCVGDGPRTAQWFTLNSLLLSRAQKTSHSAWPWSPLGPPLSMYLTSRSLSAALGRRPRVI